MRRRVLERRLEGGVPDQELRLGLPGVVRLEGSVLGLREQDGRQRNGRRGFRGHRDDADLLERRAGHELDRVDGALGRDAIQRLR